MTEYKTPKKKRVTRLSALEMLERKHEMKIDFKEKELDHKRLELEFQKEKFKKRQRSAKNVSKWSLRRGDCFWQC